MAAARNPPGRDPHASDPMPRLTTLLLSLLLAAPLAAALAQTPAPATTTPPPSAAVPDARELTPAERTAYLKSLAEASALIKEQRYADAVARLDALLAQRPREPQTRFLRAIAIGGEGRTDEAMAALSGLVADFPELPEPWNNLAVMHAQKGNYESARVALESAVRAAPGWPVAQENLGDVHARLAAAAYDEALRADPANKTAAAKLAAIRAMFPAAKPATQ